MKVAVCDVSAIIMLIYCIASIETRRRHDYIPYGGDTQVSSSLAMSPSYPNVLQKPLQSVENSGRNFYFAGDDGIIRVVDSEEPVDTVFINNYTKDPKNNIFWLYSRANPDTPKMLFNCGSQSIVDSNFDEAKETIFLVHGWKGHSKTNMNRVLTKGFLKDNDVNVIVFDWSKLANTSYNTAKAATSAVGITLGKFINWMFQNGFVMYHKIHLVGFSLGGHLVGNAGRETGAAVARITALDPAGPLWYEDKDRLVSTDAQYVEVIHTNAKIYGLADAWALGDMHPSGDADFYPNGGVMMEGCVTSNVCSHCRSYEYMANSLTNNSFKANKCADYSEMENNECTGPISLMGTSDLYKEGRGIFRVNTKPFYPYV